MDAEAGVALTETEKGKTIADEPPVATDAITIGLAQERPERAFLENPIAWWGDTPWLLWNKEYGGILGLWSGTGEAEALGELFFDNLATLLSVTGLMLGFFLNVLVANAAKGFDDLYAEAIVSRYTTLYYERCIPARGPRRNSNPSSDTTSLGRRRGPALRQLILRLHGRAAREEGGPHGRPRPRPAAAVSRPDARPRRSLRRPL